ncbi:HNH endonuclease [Pseudomonas sp. B6002]|uniref:HNH endonuclease n=1 Tax=Pseudomonas sp. B6002 TaxID=2726978 RepID=UPI0015A30998|nr:HNH endonuclease [Pseudomonas sp. B6002]NVZ53456.1 HNH endonuclease [Pseudomonas sp. B6002]
MHNLEFPACQPEEQLRSIIDRKRGNTKIALDEALTRVLQRYDLLQEHFDNQTLTTLGAEAWEDEHTAALLHCYAVEVDALSELKRLIRGNQPLPLRKICPYCGIGSPGQFDHYLPKARFPEFSVHAYNLVPCCGQCNAIKGETWLVNGARAFINFYADALPTSAIVCPEVDWLDVAGTAVPNMTFSLVCPDDFDAHRFALIEQHFDRLNLLERYREEAPSEFYDLRISARARKATTTYDLRVFLQGWIDQHTEGRGPVNWKLALYQELVNQDRFLHDCLT